MIDQALLDELPIEIQEFIRKNWNGLGPYFDSGELSIKEGEILGGRAQESSERLSFDMYGEYQQFLRTIKNPKTEILSKALGLHKNQELTIVDGTCGTGKDLALMMALSARANFIGIERNPVVYILLLSTFIKKSKLLGSRVKIEFGDIFEKLESLDADVIYFDPMFPEKKKKSALPRKEMQLFQQFVGKDEDSSNIFKSFYNSKIERLVIKRPLKSSYLSDENPSFNYLGKTTRYDIYKNQ